MECSDFKLFAAQGPWFGWTALVPMILMASVIGAMVGIGMEYSSGLRRREAMCPSVLFWPGLALPRYFGPSRFFQFIGL
jgi:leader peptidase (prepilin peptidase)/N-methyltransferase